MAVESAVHLSVDPTGKLIQDEESKSSSLTDDSIWYSYSAVHSVISNQSIYSKNTFMQSINGKNPLRITHHPSAELINDPQQ